MPNWNKPAENVIGLAVIAGADCEELQEWLPSRKEIPEEFWTLSNPWNDLTSTLFFDGGRLPPTKEGIDRGHAARHLRACLSSMEPEHNHKIAGCAFLVSLWYTEPVLSPAPAETHEAPKPKFDPNSRNQQKKREKLKRKHKK